MRKKEKKTQMLTKISGVGPKTLKNLAKLNIHNMEDLVNHYPFRYEVLEKTSLNEEKSIVEGKVVTPPTVYYFNYQKNILKFKAVVDERKVNVYIYNRAFLKAKLKVGSIITIIGKYNQYKNTLVASEILFGKIPTDKKITPIYHQTAQINNKKIIKLIKEALNHYDFKTNLPLEVEQKYNLLDIKTALWEIHFPSNETLLERAKLRLKYEELFVFMLKINYLRQNKTNKGLTRSVNYDQVSDYIKTLPFTLTADQDLVWQDIYHDLTSDKRMNRLLQGDVGSGKTLVAIIAMYINHLGGYMSAMMVPTEVLAKQHYETITQHLPNLKVVLLTSSTKNKKKIKEDIQKGYVDIIVGTHALLTSDVVFANLGLVITDEQHRFGVNQRKNLINKGIVPDVLYMSATPIPRTYALTIYGDMDISSIKTMPANRQKVATYVKTMQELKTVLEMMYQELRARHQIYVIAPLIEESEESELESAEKIYQNMQKAFGAKYQIGLLHGKLKPTEKNEIMTAFQANKMQILVSTTVIEVGIDVANATMMVVYNSQMFGLATLHQLRGRVGRSEYPSKCILLAKEKTPRLRVLEKTNDGFVISEEDFKLRGGGDLFGHLQSGDMKFKIADIKEDYKLLVELKKISEAYLIEEKMTPAIKKILADISKLA